MTTIVIQDLQKDDLISELEYNELNAIQGGIAPAIVYGLYIAGSGVAGIGAGYGIAALLD